MYELIIIGLLAIIFVILLGVVLHKVSKKKSLKSNEDYKDYKKLPSCNKQNQMNVAIPDSLGRFGYYIITTENECPPKQYENDGMGHIGDTTEPLSHKGGTRKGKSKNKVKYCGYYRFPPENAIAAYSRTGGIFSTSCYVGQPTDIKFEDSPFYICSYSQFTNNSTCPKAAETS